jgi:transcription elongation factor S-II
MAPEKFIKLTPQELADEEMQKKYLESEKRNLKNSMVAKNTGAATVTDMFECKRCKSRVCMYHQLQTRSADEPMTTFVRCTKCNHAWKFC